MVTRLTACLLYRDVVRNQGKWDNHEVAIKMLAKDSVSVSLQLRLEIKAMRDIRHKNLAAFIGACCDSPNVCVLMELGPKGSLDDLLSSESIKMDWNFKYSLLKVSPPQPDPLPTGESVSVVYVSRRLAGWSGELCPHRAGPLPGDDIPFHHSHQVSRSPQSLQLCSGQQVDPQDHRSHI